MDDDAEHVILVDLEDREIGRASKMPAHRLGYLHRAISICIVDGRGNMLLQRRAASKYHSAGLWTNACCSHPRPGETNAEAASCRLAEELDIACPLHWRLRTHYEADVGGGLRENEIVHLFTGTFDGAVTPRPAEADAVRWISRHELLAGIGADADAYTFWFKHYIRSFGDEIFRAA